MAWFGDNKIGRIGRFWGNDPTLAGYWQLNGNPIDNSGNSNSLSPSGTVNYPPSQLGLGADFGTAFGGGGKLGIGSNLGLNLYSASTFSVWAKLHVQPTTASEQTDMRILDWRGNVGGTYYYLLLDYNNTSGTFSLNVQGVAYNIELKLE